MERLGLPAAWVVVPMVGRTAPRRRGGTPPVGGWRLRLWFGACACCLSVPGRPLRDRDFCFLHRGRAPPPSITANRSQLQSTAVGYSQPHSVTANRRRLQPTAFGYSQPLSAVVPVAFRLGPWWIFWPAGTSWFARVPREIVVLRRGVRVWHTVPTLRRSGRLLGRCALVPVLGGYP